MTQQLDELLKTKCHHEKVMLENETEKEVIDGLRRELINSQKVCLLLSGRIFLSKPVRSIINVFVRKKNH